MSSFFMPPELLDLARSYGTRVVLLHTESPYEDERQLALAPHADVNLLNDPTNIERFAEVSIARYVPHAYRPDVHRPGPAVEKWRSDFAFVGTGYPTRIRFFERMTRHFDGVDVLLAGNWQAIEPDSPLRKYVPHELDDCFDNADGVDVYRSTRIGINLYRREAENPALSEGLTMGPREVEMAATGLFFMRDPRPEGDDVLHMLPTFASPEDAAEQVRYWLAHEDERNELAAKARDAVADRTFVNHAAALLRLLDRQPAVT